MSETNKRTIAEIQTEYQNLCLKAGHLQYQVYTFSKDLDMVNTELRALNLEAAAVKAAEASAPTPEAAPATEEAPAESQAENVTAFRAKGKSKSPRKEATQ